MSDAVIYDLGWYKKARWQPDLVQPEHPPEICEPGCACDDVAAKIDRLCSSDRLPELALGWRLRHGYSVWDAASRAGVSLQQWQWFESSGHPCWERHANLRDAYGRITRLIGSQPPRRVHPPTGLPTKRPAQVPVVRTKEKLRERDLCGGIEHDCECCRNARLILLRASRFERHRVRGWRLARGLTITQAAAHAVVPPHVWRSFEVRGGPRAFWSWSGPGRIVAVASDLPIPVRPKRPAAARASDTPKSR